MEPLPTDIAFTESPPAGAPNCFCSRCRRVIEGWDTPLRIVFLNYRAPLTGGKKIKSAPPKEYRYCFDCQAPSTRARHRGNNLVTNMLIIVLGAEAGRLPVVADYSWESIVFTIIYLVTAHIVLEKLFRRVSHGHFIMICNLWIVAAVFFFHWLIKYL